MGAEGGSATVLQGDAADLPLPDASVDLIVTSPPFWSLRAYVDNGRVYDGQIGAEPTPGEYIANLVRCTKEWMRVLKPTGSLWVNLGDKYATRYSSERRGGRAGLNNDDRTRGRSGQNRTGMPEKSLIGLPWRYALRCVDDLGLILRAEVIWSKPNAMPESVTDRVRRSHEQWFHFTLQPRYFAAVDGLRKPHTYGPGRGGAASGNYSAGSGRNDGSPHTSGGFPTVNPLGRVPGSVWEIATQPLRVPTVLGIKHFATFPLEWPKRLIEGWCPQGGTVLDPFGGSGTTALMAKVMGRHGISVDLSGSYCELAAWRVADPKEVGRAERVAKGVRRGR